eukprot:GDKJ01049390.1.p1 GENE.GDKJ01049390.1~~GDKJ01049390.1.p1  ORF type:complete len:555 (-),score=135.22 GDKJ01049390.1:1429-3093(-)
MEGQAQTMVPDSFYKCTLNGIDFSISRRYELVEIIGQGAYGVVVAAKDLNTGEMVAIKKMQHTFEHSTFTKRTLRELRILRHLQHENVVRIRDINTADGGREDFDEIYVVCDLMETDLGAIIKSEQALCDEHFQFFLYQLLRGLKYCHSAGVVHRDLKPRNLLVNANCDLRICDFGLARVVFPNEPSYPREMTEYVATRWYRAPEILWAWPNYGAASDVWSAGCILGELLKRGPLFPGRNTQHQLKQILQSVGTPSPQQLDRIPNPRCREFILSLPFYERTNWQSAFPDANPLALDLLDKMLRLLPDERISIDDALAHPYLQLLHHVEDEPTRTPLDPVDFMYEKCPPTTEVLRAELWRESHPELFADPPLPCQTLYPPPPLAHQQAAALYKKAIDDSMMAIQEGIARGRPLPSVPGEAARTHIYGLNGEPLGVTAKLREDAINALAHEINRQQQQHAYLMQQQQQQQYMQQHQIPSENVVVNTVPPAPLPQQHVTHHEHTTSISSQQQKQQVQQQQPPQLYSTGQSGEFHHHIHHGENHKMSNQACPKNNVSG